MGQHTGQSWHIAQKIGPPYITAAPSWVRIATIKEQDNADETYANAQLIAQAPALLDALILLTARLKTYIGKEAYRPEDLAAVQQANRIIATATGKSPHPFNDRDLY